VRHKMAGLRIFAMVVFVASAMLAAQVDGSVLQRLRKEYGSSSSSSRPAHCDQTVQNIEVTCAPTNSPNLVALTKTHPDQQLTKIRSTPFSVYCSEFTAAIRCWKNAIESVPHDCWDWREVAVLEIVQPAITQGLELAEDICTNDVQTIQDNINCLTDAQREDDVMSCATQMFQSFQENPSYYKNDCELARDIGTCFAVKVGGDPGCNRAVEAVLNKAVHGVYNIALPFCQSAQHGGPGAQLQQLKKLFF